MTVSVAANPGAKPDSWQASRRNEGFRMIAGVGPGLSEAEIDIVQDAWKYFLEVVNHISTLFSHTGLGPQNFSGSPETLERDFDLIPDCILLLGSPHPVLAADYQAIERPVLIDHSQPFCLGGMSRQHRFDSYFVKLFCNKLFRDT